MTAAAELVVDVTWTDDNGPDGERGRSSADRLFEPHQPARTAAAIPPWNNLARAFPRSQATAGQVPPPTAAKRTTTMPVLGANDVPVPPPAAATGPQSEASAQESTVVLPQLPEGGRPALQGWSDIDEHLHRVDRAQAPIPGGWWWSHCDKTVTRGQPRDLDEVPVEQLCPRCWDVPALLAARRERKRQAGQTETSKG